MPLKILLFVLPLDTDDVIRPLFYSSSKCTKPHTSASVGEKDQGAEEQKEKVEDEALDGNTQRGGTKGEENR